MTASIDQRSWSTLILLRWWAAVGQASTVLLALHVLKLPFAALPLWGAVGALVLFNLFLLGWPPRQPGHRHVAAQLVFDIAQLSVVLACAGGAMNPFVSLLLVPIALAALALPVRMVVLIAVLAALGYAAAVSLGPPMPHWHGGMAATIDLHLIGMAVNFLLSAVVFVLVLTRLLQARSARERELASLREQLARSEGILGLASHAAGMAHALNTPLATLTLLLDDLRSDVAAQPLVAAEVDRARELVDVCRDQVRALVSAARAERRQAQSVATCIIDTVERWRLMRPDIELDVSPALPVTRVVAGAELRLMLHSLLDNAAEASRAAGEHRVQLNVTEHAQELCITVIDHGGSSGDWPPRSMPLQSAKQDGWGLGLALLQSAVERYQGRLDWQRHASGGQVRLCLPWSALVDGSGS
jgi:two-component system sensor histidine kinase RegB